MAVGDGADLSGGLDELMLSARSAFWQVEPWLQMRVLVGPLTGPALKRLVDPEHAGEMLTGVVLAPRAGDPLGVAADLAIGHRFPRARELLRARPQVPLVLHSAEARATPVTRAML